MEKQLKEVVVPVLREHAFRGSFPHFYRERSESVDLLTFQFAGAGGSFVVEISSTGPKRENVDYRPDRAAKELRVADTRKRFRLGSEQEGSDHWYCYEGDRPSGTSGSPRLLADLVVQHLISEGIPWWNNFGA